MAAPDDDADYDSDDTLGTWEYGISTDLVPTLLDMYDALYARLSEGGKDGGGGGGKGEQKKEDGGVESTRVCSEPTTKENPNTGAIENGGLDAGSAGTSSEISTDNLYIREIGGESVVVVRNEGQLCSMCQGKRTQSDGKCECSAKASLAESRSSKFDKIEQEREPMDPTTPSQWSIDSPEGIIESSQRSIELSQRSIDFHKNSDVYRGNLQRGGALYSSSRGSLERDGALSIVQGKDGGAWDGHYDNIKIGRRRREHIYAEPRFIAKGHVASKVTHTQMPQATSGPTKTVPSFDPRKIQDVYRPLSSISSSSSSSSNSLPRGTPGTAVSFLAFAESLEDNDADHSDTEETTRRRDRTIKIRREKAQRTGSGDSGVQCSTISLPAPPTLRPRYCDPNLAYMDRIVLEILETEAVYVRDMREIIQGYLEYWRRVPDTGIAPHHIVDLFSNIEQIYAFNRGFLAELETCGVDPVEVARCFVRNNAGFSIYTHYCTNYPRTVSVLTELMRGEASVRAFRERQLALSHTLPLGSYLLKPVQRVLKYHLLLGNIVKHFKEDQPGYTEIWNALAVMTGMAQHINDMKRRHEHAVRVQEIQSLLYGWQFEDLTTYGELAAEGTFKVCGAKGLRHIFLFEKMILIAKKKEENILMYKTHILCSNLMLIESVPGEPLSFHIIPFDNPRLQYTLEARNLEQKREWTLQLKRVILENYSANIPAHARQLVMELGQSKPEDVAAIEGRSGGKRAHHAPEYLERRKMDRDRRRSSEGVLNTSRLRLRRPSRARKDKDAEKGSRSRSVSRTRDTEDEETDRKVSNASVPSSAEKPKLKISNMWGRRRSEPGIGSRESLSLVQASVSDLPTTPNTPDTPCLTPDTPCTPTQDIRHPSSCQACPPTPEASGDGLSMSDNEQDEEGGEDTENGENLEEIVSQLLQHNLQLQKLLLGKQRRQLARKKPFQYETSDTENEDSPLKSICKSYNGSDGDGTLRHEDMADYVEFYVNNVGVGGECTTRNGSTNVSSSECQSVYSSAMSVHQSVGELKSGLSSDKRSKPVRRSSSDLSCKKVQNKRVISNYDNLLNIWSSIRGRSPEKRQGVSSQQTRLSPAPSLTTSDKPMLHRAQSFSVEKCLNSSSNSDSMYESSLQLPVQPGMSSTINDSSGHIWVRDELRGSPRERPVTIAIYNSNEVSLSALEQYLNQPCHQGNTHERFPYETEDNLTDYSITPHMSMDNILSIHPEHKIYKPSNKSTIKNVFSKITSPRSKSVSEPSGSVFNLSVDSELDQKNMEKKASKMVYNMARQCSKTLKERIKQIRAEDDKPKSPIMENIYSLPIHKQGSSSIGARLAGTNELSDYAVPRIRLAEGKSRSELRPDSVLSSSSILTSSSSSSSTKLTEGMEAPNMANVEEETEENPESQACESDASADSYYERSFEAIESLETEIFRDSAIYSDPDENESPPSSLYQDKFPTSPHTKSTVTRKPTPRFTSRSTALSESTKASVSIESQAPKSPSKTTENNENKLLVLQINISSTSQPKKVPPPVPAKPDSVKGRKTRAYGNLIQQQLKNLEECSRFSSRDNQGSPTFDGLKTLDDRRRDLDVCQVRVNDADMAFPLGPMDRDEEEEFVGSRHLRMTRSPSLITPSAIIKSPITLSPLSHSSHHQLPITRSSSVPPRLSPGPSLTLDPPKPASLGTASPLGSERGSPLPSSKPTSPQLDGNAGEEPRMPRGWVRHVIGKLQAESDV